MTKTNDEILKDFGWEVMIGYIFDYDKDEKYNNILITKEECENLLKQEPQKYYFNEDYDYLQDEDSALEMAFDDWCGDNDNQDIYFEEWLVLMQNGKLKTD